MAKEILRQVSAAKVDIQDGDLLLFRGKGLMSRLIRTYGRGYYSHAAKASWLKGELFCLEVRELKGGRAVTIGSQVNKFPGQIDVYKANAINAPVFNRVKSDELMLLFAGVEYGYWDIIETFVLHFPVIRMLAKPNVDDDFVSKRPPYCSAACAIADRVGGGVDPVPNLADKHTEPSDLARSPFYCYMFTLIPDVEVKAATGETNEAAETMSVRGVAEPASVTEFVDPADNRECAP